MKLRPLMSLAMLAFFVRSSAAEPAPRFQVPTGFVVEQVAAPPLVRYPLFASFDNEGRLYVAEGTGQNVAGKEIVNKKLGRIVVLEDKNGDGKFDTSRVFADGLVFPQGVLWHDGSVYAASHPSFWKLTDTKGTGVADRREEIVTGFNFNGNGCDIHGPFLGPDGRLYWTDGRHGYKIKTRDGKQFEGLASRIWRCKTDGTELERLCGGGFDNPVEIAWTADGEMIGTMDQGPGDCLLHYVEGGVYPMEHPCLKEFVWTGSLLGAVKQYSVALPAALCGTMRYRSPTFGPEFRDNLITTHYMTHKLVRSKLIRDGSTYRAEDTDFLVSSDPNLRLTDVLEDADGSILFVDMGAWFTYGFLGNPIPRPESQGGIYRIRRVDALPVKDPWGTALQIEKRSPAGLIKLLDDPRAIVRDQAMQHLAKCGREALVVLEAVLRSGEYSVQTRRNAVWALCRDGTPSALAVLHPALRDKDMTVRLAAVHALGLGRDTSATAALAELVQAGPLPLRRKAAEALGRVGQYDPSTAVAALRAGLRRPVDRFLEHSLIYSLIQIHHRNETLSALTDSDANVRRAGLIALDQMKGGGLAREDVVRVLNTDDAALQRAAPHVVSRRPEWAPIAQGILRQWLSKARLTPEQESAMTEIVLAGSADPVIQSIIAAALVDPIKPPTTRAFLVRIIGQYRGEALPMSWVAALETALSVESTRREVLAAIASRKWRQFDSSLHQLSRDPGLSAEIRLAALECLAVQRSALDKQSYAFLIEHLSQNTDPLQRLSAARTLAASPLTVDQLIDLARACGTWSTMVLRLLMPVFGKSNDDRVGAALVETLHQSPAAAALSVAELDQTLKRYSAAVRSQAEPLREKLLVRQKGQAAYLAGLSAELDRLPGHADLGKEIFLAPKNNCFACHRAAGRGGNIGPELTHIGKFRTKAELLESIIFPSLTIAPEYRSHQVTTKDGKGVTGLIIRDAADALVLRLTDLSEIRIARTNIEDIAPATVSLMPDGLERTLSRHELRDLLEFLVQQK